METVSRESVVIIGGGPAGVMCAVQLRRHGLDPLLFEPGRIGGLLRDAGTLENCPGFPDGIKGPALARLLEQQLDLAGVRRCQERVQQLEWDGHEFSVRAVRTGCRAGIAVVASGTVPRPFPLMVPPEGRTRVWTGLGVLRSRRGCQIVILGAGDAAFDYALTLSGRNQVTILQRSAAPAGLPLLVQRAEAAGVTRLAGTSLVKLGWDRSRHQLLLNCRSGGKNLVLPAGELLSAIGREPADRFFGEGLRARQSDLQQQGRLYFAGDVVNGRCRQAAIAAGDGLRTAMLIAGRLSRAEGEEE